MQGGFKQTNLGPEFQRELEKFKREVEGIQQRIDEKKRERTRVEYQIRTEKEIILKGNSQKKQKIVSLERTIRGADGEIKNAAEKDLAKIRNLDVKIAEAGRGIKMLKDELDQKIKAKEIEKERLEKEKIKIKALVSASSGNISKGKIKAVQEKEGIERIVKSQVASLNLQKFENNLKEINNSILQLERQKIEAERSLSSTRSRLRR